MPIERELKLCVPPGFRLPLLLRDGGVEGITAKAEEPRRIRTAYFDTHDLRISRWGCGLRYDADCGWTVNLPPGQTVILPPGQTVKLPLGQDGVVPIRDEHVFAGGPTRPPKEAMDLLTAYVRAAPVACVARLSTLRTRVELRDPQGVAIGAILDDEVSVLEGRRVAVRYREVGLALGPSVDAEQFAALLSVLRAAGAGDPRETASDLQPLGPRAAEPPELALFDLGDDPSAADVVRLALTASAIRMLRQDAGVRLGVGPESVHHARVATRRFRSNLRTYRSILDPNWTAALRAELRWIATEFGVVRDSEVLWARMRGSACELPESDVAAAGGLLDQLSRRQDEARRVLLEEMRQPRYIRLLDRVVEAAKLPSVNDHAARPASEVLPDVMAGPWQHLQGAMDALGETSSDDELHAARIRAKRARYAAESMIPVYGKRARAFAEAAVALQDLLGEHQDAVVTERWLREAAAGASPETAFVAGELASSERAAAARQRKRWPAAWKALARKRQHFWT